MKQNLFGHRARGERQPTTQAGKLVAALEQQAQQQGGLGFYDKNTAKAFITLEGFDESVADQLDRQSQDLSQFVTQELGGVQLTNSQLAAGNYGALAGSVPQQFMQSPGQMPALESDNYAIIRREGAARPKVALEAYDETDNRHATAYTTAYNLLSAKQDEFCEAFFQTVVVPADQVGYVVSLRLINVINDSKRDISGKIDDFNKRNIIHGVIDPTILDNDSTVVVPVVRAESAANFVPAATVPNWISSIGGESITTGALAFGKSFSLLGISQTAGLLQTGLLTQNDALDASIKLEAIYMTVGTGADQEAIKIRTGHIPLAQFNAAPQGKYRKMNLSFDPQNLVLANEIKDSEGNDSVALADIVTGGFIVKLGLSVTGSVDLETSTTLLQATGLQVTAVEKDGVSLALDSAEAQPIVDLFAGAQLVGYDLKARRVNSNRRQRGQLLQTEFYQQLYTVPLHAPITIARPVTISDQTDAADLAALVTATHIRINNAGVSRLLQAVEEFRPYAQSNFINAPAPEFLGIANYLVKVFFEEDKLDFHEVDSLKSFERMADVQALLVNKIRDIAYRAYRDTGYKAAADALAGGVAPKPTVIVGTDPVIANYLMVTGDYRTVGNEFDLKIVSTLDERVTGKIFITLGQIGDGTDGQPNPLHFGTFAWKPELTIVIPMTRNGEISKELSVSPAFTHEVNCPILAVLTVENLHDVVASKVPVNTHEVP